MRSWNNFSNIRIFFVKKCLLLLFNCCHILTNCKGVHIFLHVGETSPRISPCGVGTIFLLFNCCHILTNWLVPTLVICYIRPCCIGLFIFSIKREEKEKKNVTFNIPKHDYVIGGLFSVTLKAGPIFLKGEELCIFKI